MKATLKWAGWEFELTQEELERLEDSELEAEVVIQKGKPVNKRIILAQSEAFNQPVNGEYDEWDYYFDAKRVRYTLDRTTYTDVRSHPYETWSHVMDAEESITIRKPGGASETEEILTELLLMQIDRDNN